jgi:cytochrome c2
VASILGLAVAGRILTNSIVVVLTMFMLTAHLSCGNPQEPATQSTMTESEAEAGTVVLELPFPEGDAARGAEMFSNTCVVCHGPAGNGAPGVAPDLGERSHAWHHPDRENRGWIANGKFGLRNNMPAYGGALDEQDISDVIAYVRTLWSTDQRVIQRDVSLRYEEGYRKFGTP